MTQKFNNLIDLVKIVTEMERDLGLDDISNSERNVLLAISDLENSEGVAKTKAILSDVPFYMTTDTLGPFFLQ